MPLNVLPIVLWETVPFGDPDAFTDWLLPHWLAHIAVAEKTGTSLVPLDDLRKESFAHAQMHKDQAAKLGLPVTFDFAGYDLSDKSSFYDFMLSHATAHGQLNQAAGL